MIGILWSSENLVIARTFKMWCSLDARRWILLQVLLATASVYDYDAVAKGDLSTKT